MTKVKRLIEATLHTGQVSYLIGEARTGVGYPVLEEVLEGRYKACIASAPFDGPSSLFHRIYEPTRAMHALASDLFPSYKGRPDKRITQDATIWKLVRTVQRMLSASSPDARRKADQMMPNIAHELSQPSGESVSALSLAVAAEAYRQTGTLRLRDAIAASVGPATLLVMLGVPRERVACFGIYYQDPTVFSKTGSQWTGGFYAPAPSHAMFGVYVGGRWVPVDFTRLARDAGDALPKQPAPYLRNPDFGQRDDGAPQTADYAHPYTLVFPPPAPEAQVVNPSLKHIPLLQTA